MFDVTAAQRGGSLHKFIHSHSMLNAALLDLANFQEIQVATSSKNSGEHEKVTLALFVPGVRIKVRIGSNNVGV